MFNLVEQYVHAAWRKKNVFKKQSWITVLRKKNGYIYIDDSVEV